MNLYTELPSGAQSAYSEVYEAALQAELHRSITSLNGSFQSKLIRGNRYWYYAFRDVLDGKVRQLYVGPDAPQITALRAVADADRGFDVSRQAGAALAHGCASVVPRHFRILRHLGDAQFFRAGGLLIGTHAFLAIGNQIGVKWHDATTTMDIDFAHAGPRGNLALALPADIDVDVPHAIASLQMGFMPSLSLAGGDSGTYVSSMAADLRLDFLTPLRRDPNPVTLPNLKLTLQPLRFLDYLIERPGQAALLSPQGALVVSIPDPARYAMHKLLIAAVRPPTQRVKAAKDINQAAAIIAYMQDHLPNHILQDAAADLMRRGAKWRVGLLRSVEQLTKAHPGIGQRFSDQSLGEVSAPTRNTARTRE